MSRQTEREREREWGSQLILLKLELPLRDNCGTEPTSLVVRVGFKNTSLWIHGDCAIYILS